MELTDKNYKELCRLYPQIRIPVVKYATEYLASLAKTMDVDPLIASLKDCVEKHGNTESYRMGIFDKIVKDFKSDGTLEKFNNLPYEDYKSEYPKQFNDWKDDKIYVSLDVNEANWSIFKYMLGLELPKWHVFVTEKYGLHPFVANSKSFRQFVMGNLNPSRQQTFQKRIMGAVAKKFIYYNDSVVMLSADEILFEFDAANKNYWLEAVGTLNRELAFLSLQMKRKTYSVKRVESFGESVLIKKSYDTGTEELFAVNGSRFFIHYKSLILNEPIEEHDLYFEPEKNRLAKWIL